MAVELRPRIVVIGVGGAGGNAVNNMIEANLQGVEFVVANTDAQALVRSKAPTQIQLGVARTSGLGAGANPEVGMEAAKESSDEIKKLLHGAHMCFIAAGMGGGTGTGAAPIIARIAKEQKVLTVGVVTKPFDFEGKRRMQVAEKGIVDLRSEVDTLLIIPNQNLFRIANKDTTFAEAFGMADQVLYSGVRGITDLMVMPGLINLDFADVRTVMAGMGTAMMGEGEGEGENRALKAAQGRHRQPAARRCLDEGRQGRADQHHRRLRHDAVRGRRGRERSSPRSRCRCAHHPRLDLRREHGRQDPRVGRRRRPAAGSRRHARVRRRMPMREQIAGGLNTRDRECAIAGRRTRPHRTSFRRLSSSRRRSRPRSPRRCSTAAVERPPAPVIRPRPRRCPDARRFDFSV